MWRMGHICCAASARRGWETDAKLAAYVTDRLTEGWTPEQVAIGAPLVRATMATGRLRLGIERGLGAVCTETIYGWIYRTGQKAGRLWRYLTRHHARRRKRHGRASRDTIAEKTHISQRSEDADAVCHCADIFHVVRDQNDPVTAGANPFDQVKYLRSLGDAEGRRGLVEHDDLRVEQQRPGDGDRLSLAARKRCNGLPNRRDAGRKFLQ
jgi:hypothetical protein